MGQFIPFSAFEAKTLKDSRSEIRDESLLSFIDVRIADITDLAKIVARMPLMNDLGISDKPRSIESLTLRLANQGFEEVVNIPSKAQLGRSLVVSKLHLFGFLLKISQQHTVSTTLYQEVFSCYHSILFSLMAEDLYISIISDSEGYECLALRAMQDLVQLWDERSSTREVEIAPLVRQLWEVRHSLVPTLGTLLGTVELLKLSLNLPPIWQEFLQSKGGETEVAQALEEFLFSLSYEQIAVLERHMAELGLHSLAWEQAFSLLKLKPSQMLEGPDSDDIPARRLYRSFKRRDALCRQRRESDRPGPKQTLEQHLMLHLWETEGQRPLAIL